MAECVATCVRTCVLAILNNFNYPEPLGLMISIKLFSLTAKQLQKKKMRILKSHPLLKLVNSYLIDASQPSNISYL